MKDISRIFLEISSKKGNINADQAILKDKNTKIELFLNKYLEFLSVNLQAEFNRISCSPLGKLKTNEIGSKINDIIEEHIARVIYLVERETDSIPFIKDYFSLNLRKLYEKINEDYKAEKALKDIFELNLIHDFGQIVDHLCHFEVQTIDLFLKYLILINLHRRLQRRNLL